MLSKTAKLGLMLISLLSCVVAQAQSSAVSSVLVGNLTPGETLRFEIETSTSYSADVVEGYSTTLPLGPCQYSLSSALTIKSGSVGPDGNIPIHAEFHEVNLSSWDCRDLNRAQLEKALREFAASNVVYQLGPHGEVRFQPSSRDRFTYMSAVDLLNKIALDLLQTNLADKPVIPGSSWKPHGQFIYWKDYLLSGLDVSAAVMRWKETTRLAGCDCASITSKYVFAPTQSSAGPVTARGSLRQQPTNVVSGVLDISLLFDLQTHRIKWLDRSYKVENHVSVQPEEEPDPEILTIRWEEEAKARLVPDKDSIEWLAELKRFESTSTQRSVEARPRTESTASLADLAAAAAPKNKSARAEINTLDPTPEGFSRWERQFCESSWYCTELSIALPGEFRVAEETPLQTTYLSRTSSSLVTITLGPVLQRKYQGLTAAEELKKQADFYLANHLWMMNKPGISIKSQNTFIDGYPARLTTFQGARRDLASIRGMLTVLLGSTGESFPITCTVDQRNAPAVQATCDRILRLVRMRLLAP
jgi:hypothetical protein